jgi:catechol 2,3-dioxygenase-like lactoylglutathione lyase family enzyme
VSTTTRVGVTRKANGSCIRATTAWNRRGTVEGMEAQPLICVADVPAASRWYVSVLGLTSAHGGDEYEQLTGGGGRVVLQLHDWDAHEHHLLGAEHDRHGNGVALWFQTEDFGAAVERIRGAGAAIADGPFFNPIARHHEVWLHDADGYLVVVAGPYVDTDAVH